ncbi:Ig-like domain-containing protein [Nakamurella leprariae]|uniref:Ig-like domain-containing protein n=1 Tax=Nakamurella leprariae TaxID=2803911 RepID=A0A938YGW0_9ACTN|nr:Ig-like domain-containing protein [Nakamurella leprariae]MBM9467879.1 Ig-like domain-containing protein [Nakamurella leprariae]
MTRAVSLGAVLTLLLAVVGGVVSTAFAASAPQLAAPAPAGSPIQVDFGSQTTVPVAGYVLDWGQPYGARTGANQGSNLTYGWVTDGSTTPVDLTGNGRIRYVSGVDAKQTTLMHMQLAGKPAGAFEIQVADGWYTVTVGVGDASTTYDSTHAATVEGIRAVEPYVPTQYTRLTTGTATVQVTDGRLTVRPEAGTNAKITFLTATAVPPPAGDPTFPFRVDFGAGTSVPVPGNVLDSGGSYGPKGYATYGWVVAGSRTPLNLSNNGRQRTASGLADPRQVNFMQMQAVPSSGANTTAGDWTMVVPNGAYRVTVGTGDPNNVYDSTHRIQVNGRVAIDPYVPTFSSKFRIGVVDVDVTDGRLVVSAAGGTNTKIDFLDVEQWTDPSPPPFPAYIDFGTPSSTPAAGYQLDSGARFGPKQAGYTYGWEAAGTDTPLDVSANARQRPAGVTTDPRLLGLIQMQSASGVTTPAQWELAVPNGTYKVTVAVGDASAVYDSTHLVEVENVVAVGPFKPTATTRFTTGTVTVSVIDGRLTVAPTGGVNTKIDYLTVEYVDPTRPRVAMVAPGGDETNVVRDLSVTTELSLPAGAIDPNTVTAGTVKLVKVSTGAVIESSANTSGGGDVLVLTPKSVLEANTQYQFMVTDGVTDVAGNKFLPFESLFTTGTLVSGTGIAGVGFTQQATVATNHLYTSVTTGPDGKLYAATLNGYLFRYDVAPDGTLANERQINTVRTMNSGQNRTMVGLAFDPSSTASNLILWVTDNFMYVGNDNVPDWSSKLVRLTGANLESGQTVLTNLPRSAHDHEANSIAFGPDGALYFSMGSNTGMGYQDIAWGNRPEVQLAGAVLRLDTGALPASLPLDVKTTDGGGSYDPYAPGAPLTLYATGVRNAYDLAWHSNGHLYAPTNGSAAGANIPMVSDPLPASCNRRIDAASGPYTYTGPAFNTIFGNPVAQTDFIHEITQGGYYGHPNPSRCEFISYGGNPTAAQGTPWEEAQYPVGVQPDRNFRSGDIYDAGLHASANGTIEYRSNAFGGKLKGKLLVVRYSAGKDVMVVDPSGPDGSVTGITTGVTGMSGFTEPLDIAEHPSGNGILYVTELGGQKITLLRPVAGG